MNTSPDGKVCFYHGNCFDGMAAAWVVSKRFPHGVEFIPTQYGNSNLINSIQQDCYENANINTEYIIVDFSFPRDLMIQMSNKAKSMIVLDHHKTAEEACKGLDFCKFDMNESGASLAWKYLFPNKEVPRLVRYIADRDLWKFELPNSEIINAFIQSFPMDLHEYEMLHHNLESDTGMLEAQLGGTAINRYKQTMVEAMCKNAAFSSTEPFFNDKIPIVNASILFSEVGHELCKKFPGAPFAAYYFDRVKDNVRQWGLRSIGDFDVSAVAKDFGGGGHKNAAGFETSLSEV